MKLHSFYYQQLLNETPCTFSFCKIRRTPFFSYQDCICLRHTLPISLFYFPYHICSNSVSPFHSFTPLFSPLFHHLVEHRARLKLNSAKQSQIDAPVKGKIQKLCPIQRGFLQQCCSNKLKEILIKQSKVCWSVQFCTRSSLNFAFRINYRFADTQFQTFLLTAFNYVTQWTSDKVYY